jgi:hypothetical protein
LFEMLLYLWGQSNHTTGAPIAGSGATMIQGSGDVSSVSIADFGTVRFDVGATVAGGGADATYGADTVANWGWLAPWAYILQTYRSEAAPTVAFA